MVAPTDESPTPDNGSTHARILEAALAEIRERGAHQVSFRAVAARAGLSTGTVQYYFGSKDELLEMCLDGYHKRLSQVVERLLAIGVKAAGEGAEPEPIVDEAVRTLMHFVETENALVALRLALNESQGELPPPRQKPILGAMLHRIAEVLARIGVPLETDDLVLTTQAMTAVVVRYVRLSDGEREAMLGPDATKQDVEDFVVRMALRALKLR